MSSFDNHLWTLRRPRNAQEVPSSRNVLSDGHDRVQRFVPDDALQSAGTPPDGSAIGSVRSRRAPVTGLMAALLLSCQASSPMQVENPDLELRLEPVAAGLASPVFLTAPPGDDRLFVVEQPGRIRIIRNGQLVSRAFLDITARVASGGERGLLSVAFHPRYSTNGLFFVDYTDANGNTRVERYRVSADPDVADAGSAKLILSVPQPFANHNGGLVLFGPDGRLYIGLGDGGSGGDPQGNGQNRGTLLGSILRIDVDAGDPYSIPGDNPFRTTPGARPEIWAFGLRNPWRFAFDAEDELLYIADVGQNLWEEIDVVPASAGGLNFGWNIREGLHCYGTGSCNLMGLTDPVFEYGHNPECSVTGGFVYRGSAIPDLDGHYFFSDYCAGWIRSFRFDGRPVSDVRDWDLGAGRVLSFGRDAAGELYVLNADGAVLRIVPR
jgi:glucose/arabinose dehydrogenase